VLKRFRMDRAGKCPVLRLVFMVVIPLIGLILCIFFRCHADVVTSQLYCCAGNDDASKFAGTV